MKNRRATIGIFIVFVVAYLVPLGFRPLAAPDEVRYAEIPREMLASGDWIVPRLDGMDYFEKPVLGYWAVATSMMVFGETAFAARLPSALGIALSALALAYLLQINPDGRAGPLAAMIFLTSLGVIIMGTTAILDGLFTGGLTIAIAAVFYFLEGTNGRNTVVPLLLAGIATGLAFMTKGFLALVVPALAIGPYLVIRRSATRFLAWSWVPLIAMAAVALPWSLAVAQHSDFWTHFFWVEHVQRFLEPGRTQHEESWLYYPPAISLAILPWVVAAPAAISGLRRIKTPQVKRLRLFAICWMVGPFFFFSVSSGKLMPYILPCLPPAALLLAIGLLEATTSSRRSWFSVASIFSAGVGAILVCALIVLTQTGHPQIASLMDSPLRIGSLIAGSTGWLIAAGASLVFRDHKKKLISFALSPLLFTVPILFTLDEPLVKTPKSLIERHIDRIRPDTVVVGDRNSVHSLCWELKRTDIQVFDKSGEFKYGLDHTADRDLIDIDDLVALVETSRQPVIAVLEQRRWNKYSSRFRPPTIEDKNNRYVLIELVGHQHSTPIKTGTEGGATQPTR